MASKLKTQEVILQSPNGLQEATLSLSDSGVVSSTKPLTLASPTITGNITKDGLPMFACRAWAVFNGDNSGTFSPTGAGNISSITKTSPGKYTLYFTTPMPDANYSIIALPASSSDSILISASVSELTTTYFKIVTQFVSGGSVQAADRYLITVAVFR